MRRRAAGFTLVEVLIAGGLVAVVLALAVGGTARAYAVHRGTIGRLDAERRADSALSRVLDRITDCGLSSIAEDLTASGGSSTVTFRRAEGWSAGAVVLGPQIVLTMAADPKDPVNGADDDRDGVVDNRVLTMQVGTAQPTVLVRNVRPLLAGETADGDDDNGNGLIDEPGFCVSADGEAVTVRLTLSRTGRDGNLVTVTATGTTRVGP